MLDRGKSPLSELNTSVRTFEAMQAMQRANELTSQGKPVLNLSIGQPGARMPKKMREYGAQLLEQGHFGYTDALGLPELRAGIAKWHSSRYDDHLDASQVVVTNGASGAFTLAFLATVPKNGRIGVAIPGYPAYRNIILALGFEPVEIRVEGDTNWCLTAQLIEESHKEKPLDCVLVASPANPTGTMMTPSQLREAAQKCHHLGIRFISDEIYHGLSYGIEEASARPFLGEGVDGAIVINSFSKYFCMTGWRVGWMIVPKKMVNLVERLAQNMMICAPDISQRIAISALSQKNEFEAIKADYAKNREILLTRLPQIGFEGILPIDGAFYAYLPIAPHAHKADEFCRAMLEEIYVACTPGKDFDPEQGNKMIRLSFAGKTQTISDAMDRIQNWLA